MKSRLATWIVCSTVILTIGCKLSDPGQQYGQFRTAVPPTTANVPGSDLVTSPDNETRQPIRLVSEADFGYSQAVKLATQPTSQSQISSLSVIDAKVEEATVELATPIMAADRSPGLMALEEILDLAFANNPAIKELAATTQIAAGYRTQVGLYANPTIGYQAQQLADEGTDQHLLFIEQEIVTAGKLELNLAVQNEAVRAQMLELEAQKLRVATDVKLVYFDCLRIQKQLTAIDQFSKLLSQGIVLAEDRVKAGEASRIDLLQTQVQFQELVLERRRLEASLQARLREIVALAGLPDLPISGVTGELPTEPIELNWETMEQTLVAASPEYAAAQARIRQASTLIRRQEVQPIPNLSFQVGAGVDNGTNSGMLNLQVGAPIPVFNKNEGNVAAAHAEYCRAVQEAQRIDNAIRARLAVTSGEYARAAAAVEVYVNELLPAAQETLDLAEAAYKAGEQDFVQLLVTRRTYFDANLALLSAQAELARTQAEVDGFLLTGALNAVVNNSGDDSLRGLTFGQQ